MDFGNGLPNSHSNEAEKLMRAGLLPVLIRLLLCGGLSACPCVETPENAPPQGQIRLPVLGKRWFNFTVCDLCRDSWPEFPELQGLTHPPSFAPAEVATKKKLTRREQFRTRLEALVPRTKLLAVIAPPYPKGERGRPPLGLERMLRGVLFPPAMAWPGRRRRARRPPAVKIPAVARNPRPLFTARNADLEKRAGIAVWERQTDWQTARRRGPIKAMGEGAEKETPTAAEQAKASGRSFVEHPFHLVKNLFRHRKVRPRGLARNGPQLHTRFGLANGVIGGRTATL